MKKLSLTLTTLAIAAGVSSAQAQFSKQKSKQQAVTSAAVPTTAPADTAATAAAHLADYAGPYAVQDLPFSEMVFAVKDGKLTVNVGMGQEADVLVQLKEPDTFDAAGRAIIHFQRDATKKVTGLAMNSNGRTFAGQKK